MVTPRSAQCRKNWQPVGHDVPAALIDHAEANWKHLSVLEQAETLEQLRVLEHGCAIGVAVCEQPVASGGIDTPEQYAAFVERWRAR